jgi:hypothetical protein
VKLVGVTEPRAAFQKAAYADVSRAAYRKSGVVLGMIIHRDQSRRDD